MNLDDMINHSLRSNTACSFLPTFEVGHIVSILGACMSRDGGELCGLLWMC